MPQYDSSALKTNGTCNNTTDLQAQISASPPPCFFSAFITTKDGFAGTKPGMSSSVSVSGIQGSVLLAYFLTLGRIGPASSGRESPQDTDQLVTRRDSPYSAPASSDCVMATTVAVPVIIHLILCKGYSLSSSSILNGTNSPQLSIAAHPARRTSSCDHLPSDFLMLINWARGAEEQGCRSGLLGIGARCLKALPRRAWQVQMPSRS